MRYVYYPTISHGWLPSYTPNVPILIPASSWFAAGKREGYLCFKPLKLPPQMQHVAADCGGFVATKIWGDYKYSPSEYVEWLLGFGNRIRWAATMDYCCEKEVAENAGIVRERQQKTSALAYQFWRDYRQSSWDWTVTIQGWTVADYRRHAFELKPLLKSFQSMNKGHWRVGIGTLCNRKDSEEVRRIIWTVADTLGAMPLHLWGVKEDVFTGRKALPHQIVSSDSATWSSVWRRDKALLDERASMLNISRTRYVIEHRMLQYKARIETAMNSDTQMQMIFDEAA